MTNPTTTEATSDEQYWKRRQHSARLLSNSKRFCACGLPVDHKVHANTTTEAAQRAAREIGRVIHRWFVSKGSLEGFHDTLTEIISKHCDARASQWLPIESAPKDGTRLLFYTPECSVTGWLAFVAESSYDKRGELNDVHVAQWQDGLEPTHWMPLPALPEAQNQDQK